MARMRKAKRYTVETWDPDLQQWTPQIGVPPGPFTRRELVETILPLLNDMGYSCDVTDLDDDAGASPYLSICEAGNERISPGRRGG